MDVNLGNVYFYALVLLHFDRFKASKLSSLQCLQNWTVITVSPNLSTSHSV